MKDGFAELHASTVRGLRKLQWRQVTEIGSDIGQRLRLAERRPGDHCVHLRTFALQLREVCELLDQIGLTLRGESGNHVARIANGTLAVTAGAVLQVQGCSVRRIRLQLQRVTNELIDAGWRGDSSRSAEEHRSTPCNSRHSTETVHGCSLLLVPTSRYGGIRVKRPRYPGGLWAVVLSSAIASTSAVVSTGLPRK